MPSHEAFGGQPPSDLSPPSSGWFDGNTNPLREYFYRLWQNLEAVKRDIESITEYNNQLREDIGEASDTVAEHTHGNLVDRTNALREQVEALETGLTSVEELISAEPEPMFSPPEETGSPYFPFSIGYRYRDRNQNAASVRGSWVARTASGPVTGELGTSGGTPWSDVTRLDLNARDLEGVNRSAAFGSPDLDEPGRLIAIKRYQPGDPITTGTEQMQVFRLTGSVTTEGADASKYYIFPVTQEGVPNAADEEWADGTTIEPPHDADYEIVLCLPRIRYNENFFLPRSPAHFTAEISADVAAALAGIAATEDWPVAAAEAANNATEGPNLPGDIVTLYREGASWTRRWDFVESKWAIFEGFISGDLLLSNALQSSHIGTEAVTSDALGASILTSREISADGLTVENNLQLGNGIINFRTLNSSLLYDYTIGASFAGFIPGQVRIYPADFQLVVDDGAIFPSNYYGVPTSSSFFNTVPVVNQIGNDEFHFRRNTPDEVIRLNMTGALGLLAEYGRRSTSLLSSYRRFGERVIAAQGTRTWGFWHCSYRTNSTTPFYTWGACEFAIMTGQGPPVNGYFPDDDDPNLLWKQRVEITESEARGNANSVRSTSSNRIDETYSVIDNNAQRSGDSVRSNCSRIYPEVRRTMVRRIDGGRDECSKLGCHTTAPVHDIDIDVPVAASPMNEQRRFYFLSRFISFGSTNTEVTNSIPSDTIYDASVSSTGYPFIAVTTKIAPHLPDLRFTLREIRPFG